MSKVIVEKPKGSELSMRLWNLQLEMISCLLPICSRNGLKIWAGYGTLLGCVRHKGFIPWDDDVDFVMMREDYDHLRNLIKNGLQIPTPFCFDICREEVIKLRCDGTSFIMPKYKLDPAINQSVFIDIFCLDAIPESKSFESDYYKIRRKMKMISNKNRVCFGNLRSIISIIWHLYCVLYYMLFSERRSLEWVNSALRKNTIDHNERIANIIEDCRWDRNRYLKDLNTYNKHWFDETVFLPFEDLLLPCPLNYDEVLRSEYGNYMVPVEGGADHDKPNIDLDRSYKCIIEDKLNDKPWYIRFLYRI